MQHWPTKAFLRKKLNTVKKTRVVSISSIVFVVLCLGPRISLVYLKVSSTLRLGQSPAQFQVPSLTSCGREKVLFTLLERRCPPWAPGQSSSQPASDTWHMKGLMHVCAFVLFFFGHKAVGSFFGRKAVGREEAGLAEEGPQFLG